MNIHLSKKYNLKNQTYEYRPVQKITLKNIHMNVHLSNLACFSGQPISVPHPPHSEQCPLLGVCQRVEFGWITASSFYLSKPPCQREQHCCCLFCTVCPFCHC